MAVGDIYRVVLYGVCLSQQTINEFWYRQVNGAGGSSDLAQAFLDNLLPAILAITCQSTGYNGLNIYNNANPSDFPELTFDFELGARNTASLPSYVAVSLKCARGRSDMRSGRKSFAGIPESVVENNTINDSGYIADLDLLELALNGTISDDGNANTFQQIIVRRVLTQVGDKEYYLPPNPITGNDWYLANSWNANLLISSQVSRKQKS